MNGRRALSRKRGKKLVPHATNCPSLAQFSGKPVNRSADSPGDTQTDLTISNRQRTKPINVRQLRQIIRVLLEDLLQLDQVELGISFVGAAEMTRVNETFLQHAGSTDVITFDYLDARPASTNLKPAPVHGELFICVDEAVTQARRFRTTWQSELIRYIIHGLLHLLGHDDHGVVARRQMKRAEGRLLQQLGARFPLSRLGRKPRLRS